MEAQEEAMLTKEEVVTPDCKTIADVCAYLKLLLTILLKLLLITVKRFDSCFVRGDHGQ